MWVLINVDVSVRNIVYMKEIMFEILLHVVVKVESITNDSAITCDEVKESYDEETKTVLTNFDEKI